MRISCPNCETSYRLADGALGATGRKVRCTRCGTTWHARPFDPPAPSESAAEAEWAAVEAAASRPAPTEDDWRAALAEPDPPREPVAPAPAEESDAAPEPSTAVVAVAAPDATPEPGPAASPTIEADAPGFPPRRARPRSRPARQPRASSGRRFGARILSAMVVTVATGMVVGLAAGSLFAREALVHRFPDLAGLYALAGVEVNLRGLAFADLKTHREVDGATPVLVVDGMIRNVSETARTVPRLRFGLTNTAGREVYAWTMDPADKRLEPDATMRFTSRLPAPPEAATDVTVRFTDRRGP